MANEIFVQGKIFAQIGEEANAKFDKIDESIVGIEQSIAKLNDDVYVWEKIGKVDVDRTASTRSDTDVDAEIGSIQYNGNQYEELILVWKGIVGQYSDIKCNNTDVNFNISAFGSEREKPLYLRKFCSLPLAKDRTATFYLLRQSYSVSETPTQTTGTFTLYGRRCSQAFLDILGISE